MSIEIHKGYLWLIVSVSVCLVLLCIARLLFMTGCYNSKALGTAKNIFKICTPTNTTEAANFWFGKCFRYLMLGFFPEIFLEEWRHIFCPPLPSPSSTIPKSLPVGTLTTQCSWKHLPGTKAHYLVLASPMVLHPHCWSWSALWHLWWCLLG